MRADEFLGKAQALILERGKQYDQPSGERSMGKTVRAFNAITGHSLSEAEGWLLLQTLKDVRQWQTPGKYHADSAEDGVTYSALKAEALSNEMTTAEFEFQDAPKHATHKVRAVNSENYYKWAYLDADVMRECSTQYKLDMNAFEIVATREGNK